ncbi:alpha/beta hydrolase [Actinoplanes aureus]|uniref:DUF1023 domain-containing protein n=1 Tax=Actinoplanes aureus TaxID=2792083 RepID=A0A931G3V4_9ACTN|nr:alpha/beta hydrolase [Actinoplanes aureus]MBG0564629.1 hypothetical protein [Actinoplanes aureus]
MSALTLHQLLNADPGPWHAAASAWQRLADRIDDAAEQFIGSTRDLAYAWPSGAGARAADEKATRMRAEVSNTYNPARRIYDALDRHAYGVGELRQTAEQMVTSARQAGFTVDTANGRVSAPASAYLGGNLDRTARELNVILADLEAVVERARGLDDSTANAIRVNLPDPRTRFGQTTLPPVTRATAEAQRGRPPADVRRWWETLTPQQQEQAIQDMPDLIGWLDGVPASDRDTANRLRLERDQSELAARDAAIEARMDQLRENMERHANTRGGYSPELNGLFREQEVIRAQLADLGRVETKLADLGASGMLLGVDPAGDGKVIVSVGDPDTARHTAVWVPGVGTMMGDVSGNVDRVVNLKDTADGLTSATNDVAAIMWLGYDAPELNATAVGHERSEQGGAFLDRFVDGLRATNSEQIRQLTVVGHSYGSTVVAEAALDANGLAVDDIITAGSPGMHTDRAEDLGIDPRHVWAGRAEGDGIAGAAGSFPFVHDNEPSDGDFGANRFTVDTHGHSAYWDRDTESLRNQAHIMVGKYDKVGLDHGEAPAS